MWRKALLFLIYLSLWVGGCHNGVIIQTTSRPASGPWDDGTYTGVSEPLTPQFIQVEVSITRGQIVAIHLRQHPAWELPQEQERLLQLVVASQTTEGHVPRGTGSEPDHLLRAIDDALVKARRAPAGVP
jgi:uncharacterized protein with FMN-binding domain